VTTAADGALDALADARHQPRNVRRRLRRCPDPARTRRDRGDAGKAHDCLLPHLLDRSASYFATLRTAIVAPLSFV
jgi:hypothetical protein